MTIFGLSIFDLGGTLIAIVSVICMLKKSKWYWYLSILCNILWCILFVNKSLIISAGLQITYILFSAYGILRWQLEANKVSIPVCLDYVGAIIALTIFATTILKSSYINLYSYIETIASGFLITANWLTARESPSCWYFWIIGDILFAVFLWNSKIYAMFVLQFVFLLLSFWGLQEWKKASNQKAAM